MGHLLGREYFRKVREFIFRGDCRPAQNRRIGGANAQVAATWLLVFLLLAAGDAAVAAASQPPVASAAPSTSTASHGGEVVYHGDRQSPMVALTFDDGPHPVYVPRLLALLRAEDVKATFFLVGEHLKTYPEPARAIVADGHEIGNHSMAHLNVRGAPQAKVEGEIAGMQRLVKERLGVVPKAYRPPYGYITDTIRRICEREGLPIVKWNVDPTDWKSGVTRDMIVQNVLENTTSGSIILFHATRGSTVEAVAELIPILRFRGHRFVTVSELIRDHDAREKTRPVTAKKRSTASQQGQDKGPAPGSEPQPKPPPSVNIPPLPPL